MKLIQDDKGNISSLRVILLIVAGAFVYLLFLFTLFVLHELKSDYVNYTGLAALFSAFFVSFILAIFGKVLQKKYECRRD